MKTRSSRVVRTNFGSEDIEWWVSDACYVVIALAFLDGQINRLCRTTVFAFGWHPFWTHPFVGHILRCFISSHPNGTVDRRGTPATDDKNVELMFFAVDWQGHQFHPDSQEKQAWILELSFGNAGPSSEADLYKSMPRPAFKSMSSLWFQRMCSRATRIYQDLLAYRAYIGYFAGMFELCCRYVRAQMPV